ncbi:hypothetical protein [Winogradskyella sp. 3972H.M.0a.05]|uniref:hypothetical protein n=1 Tax=Winogradskyella sp. 3972H.M.0a.05 TaxID=2950277 RepID=UPI003392B092
MDNFEIIINDIVVDFFKKNKELLPDYKRLNELLKNVSGINNFFSSEEDVLELENILFQGSKQEFQKGGREFGDFQTNEDLACKVYSYIASKHSDFEFLLEPTCGKGNFILASLEGSNSFSRIVGVEIYKPYVWETKFKILSYFLINDCVNLPEIDIIHGNVFEYSFSDLANETKELKTLIIGNPPWVTNSELGSIKSNNLPSKSNFKKLNGISAITGNGNFDIGEFITLHMLRSFQFHVGILAFLIKNSVIKNLIYDQKTNNYSLGEMEKLNIDSKKEFNASVDSSLFLTKLNSTPSFTCLERNLYDLKIKDTFGWYRDKFVNSIENYDKANLIDGISEFEWRSGVKHDCSRVMEVDYKDNFLTNRLGEKIPIESDLIYGLLKSSDLKGEVINDCRKYTIITQTKVGEQTDFIKEELPLTFKYLNSHLDVFNNRKSSIYKNKPPFSIFGIGDYSFKKYKVGISGLYKSTRFSLITPKKSRPLMLDDTCYFIGFDEKDQAEIALFLVNSDIVQEFLRSIIFLDSKRAINKNVLMRINFQKAFEYYSFDQARIKIKDLSIESWNQFGFGLKQEKECA